jgi:hypothetical protein
VQQHSQSSRAAVGFWILLVANVRTDDSFSGSPGGEGHLLRGWHSKRVVIQHKRPFTAYIHTNPVCATARIDTSVKVEDPAVAGLEVSDFRELHARNHGLKTGDVQPGPQLQIRVRCFVRAVEDGPLAR